MTTMDLRAIGSNTGTNALPDFRREYSWPIFPGPAERCELEVVAATASVPVPASVRAAVARPPCPEGLTATPADREVVLQWDPIPWTPTDWVEGPYLVLYRAEEEQAEAQGRTPTVHPDLELLRIGLDSTGFVDRAVSNGTVYFYAIEIQGTLAATGWRADLGEYSCVIPVRVRNDAGFTGLPVMAIPTSRRGIQVAILTEETGDPRVNAVVAHLYRDLAETPWLTVLERSAAAAMFLETQLAQLQSAEPADATVGAVAAAPADLLLRVRPRRTPRGKTFDVWMEDYRNGRKQRLLSRELTNLDPAATSAAIARALYNQYPGHAEPIPEAPATHCGIMRTIAVTEFAPVTEQAFPPGTMEELLRAAASQDECLAIVERDAIDALMAEWELAGAADASTALSLGEVLDADGIVSGYYGVQDDRINLSARLVDVRSGTLLKVIEISLPVDRLGDLGVRLAAQISQAAETGPAEPDSPLARWVEASLYQTDGDTQTAAYVSPDRPEHHMRLGKLAAARQAFPEALGHFQNGLSKVSGDADRWPFYTAIDSVLSAWRRPREQRRLWEDAIAQIEEGAAAQPGYGRWQDAHRRLAWICLQLDDTPAALDALAASRFDSYLYGSLLEDADRLEEAVAAYGGSLFDGTASATEWPRLGPSYAALIRIAHTTTEALRQQALTLAAEQLAGVRPYRAAKSRETLTADGFPAAARETPAPAAEDPRTAARPRRPIPPSAGAASAAPPAMLASRDLAVASGALRIEAWSDGSLLAVDPATGQQRWQYAMEPEPKMAASRWMAKSIVNAALPLDSLLLVAQPDAGVLDALDIRTGQRRWRYLDWTSITPPASYGAAILIGNAFGQFMTLDPETGGLLRQPQWTDAIERVHGEGSLALHVDPEHKREVILLNSIGSHGTRGTYGRLPMGSRFLASASLESNTVRYTSIQPMIAPQAPVDEKVRERIAQLQLPPLHSHNREVYRRSDAMRGLERLPGAELALPALFELLEADVAHESERRTAFRTIAAIAGASVYDELLPLAEHPLGSLRKDVAAYLAQYGRSDATAVLVEMLADPVPFVRQQALQSLAIRLGREAKPHMQPILAMHGSTLQAEAALYLLMAGDPSYESVARDYYSRLEFEDVNDVGEAVFMGMCKLGIPRALRHLRDVMEGKTDRYDAVDAMIDRITQYLPDPCMIPYLLLDPGRRKPTNHAARIGAILGMTDSPAAIPILIEGMVGNGLLGRHTGLLGGPAADYARALEDLTGQSHGPNKPAWQRWWLKQGQAAYADAIAAVTLPNPAALPAPADDADTPSNEGKLPLHQAAEAGDLARVKSLLEQGADIHAANKDGNIALHYAAQYGHLDVLKYLVAQGACIHRQIIAPRKASPTPLISAAAQGQTDCVTFLAQAGADIELGEAIGNSPLTIAAYYGHAETAKALLDLGARIESRNIHGWTPLLMAAQTGHPDVIQLLLRRGANPNATQAIGWNALAISAMTQQPRLAQTLLQAGADLDAAINGLTDPLADVPPNSINLLQRLKE